MPYLAISWLAFALLVVADLAVADTPVVTTITYVDKAHEDDVRGTYERELLHMALERTAKRFGPFRLVPATQGITNSRARDYMKRQKFENFVRGFAYRHTLSDDPNIRYIDFPIYLGILSYRVCFTSDKIASQVAAHSGLRDLLKYTHGQGVGWLDNRILRGAGFHVVEVADYESLFQLTAINRINLFCRGLNEYWQESNSHLAAPGLVLDESFALYYPFPIFFHAHVDDSDVLQRIEQGIFAAYHDGSLMALWERHFAENVRRAKLDKRRIYSLENPIIRGVDSQYPRYFFNPVQSPPAKP